MRSRIRWHGPRDVLTDVLAIGGAFLIALGLALAYLPLMFVFLGLAAWGILYLASSDREG